MAGKEGIIDETIFAGGFAVVLLIDIGNTNIVFAAAAGENISAPVRAASDREKSAEEFAHVILSAFPEEAWEGAIVSSVVAELTEVLAQAAERVTGKKALVVGEGFDTGLTVLLDDPTQLGADLAVAAVAAKAKYPKPIILFDIGTADTMSVIDKNGAFLGGAIMPGPALAAQSLGAGTSLLPSVSLEAPEHVIERSTDDCIRSGLIHGHAAMLDGLIERAEAELGERATVVGTGGLLPLIAPLCRRAVIRDDELMLEGLLLLYRRNEKTV